jgi:hypothetical protein
MDIVKIGDKTVGNFTVINSKAVHRQRVNDLSNESYMVLDSNEIQVEGIKKELEVKSIESYLAVESREMEVDEIMESVVPAVCLLDVKTDGYRVDNKGDHVNENQSGSYKGMVVNGITSTFQMRITNAEAEEHIKRALFPQSRNHNGSGLVGINTIDTTVQKQENGRKGNLTKPNKSNHKGISSTSKKNTIKTFNDSQGVRNNVNMMHFEDVKVEEIGNDEENNFGFEGNQGEREYTPKILTKNYAGNYGRGQEPNVNILTIAFEEIYALSGLGKALHSIPRTALPEVRETFIYAQQRVIEIMNNLNSTILERLDVLKKFAVLPTLLFTGIEYESEKELSRAANMLITCRLVRRDKYSLFNTNIFKGSKICIEKPFANMSESAIQDKENNADYKQRRVDHWVELGEVGKAFREAGPKAPYSPASATNLQILKDLHPERKYELKDDEEIRVRMIKFEYASDNNDKLKKAICSRPKGINPGPDNMSLDVIKQLYTAKGGLDYMNRSKLYAESLSQTLQHIYEDRNVPEEVKNFFRGGILHGIGKKMDAYGVILPRPVTNGNGYTKGSDGAKMTDLLVELQPKFGGVQLGVCHKDGAGLFQHSSRVERELHPELTTSKSDFKNAFNTQSRSVAYAYVHRRTYTV